jgi:uncharacterized protein
MKKEFSARHLDVLAFARAAGTLTGQDPLARYERLMGEAQGPTPALVVTWTARGEMRPVDGGADETWLHVVAQTTLPLICQRCMAPVETPIASDRWFRFAPDEASAAVLDEESEEDVLVLSGAFDLHELVEDELLMSLPLVPRHETCPVEVRLAVADPGFEAAEEEKTNPFAKLASLRLDKSG